MHIGNTYGNNISEIYGDMTTDERKEFKNDLLNSINRELESLERIKKELDLI